MNRSGRRRRAHHANFVFWIPVIVVIVLTVVALATQVSNQNGTIAIRALTSGRYSAQVSLRAPYAVGTTTGFTPSNLTMARGAYTIVFGGVAWFKTPPADNIFLPGGKTYYATGFYDPILKVFEITNEGINATSVTALHGVTPVIWLNHSTADVILEFQDGSRADIHPSQNFTRVFISPGVFSFSSLSGSFTGEVSVQ